MKATIFDTHGITDKSNDSELLLQIETKSATEK